MTEAEVCAQRKRQGKFLKDREHAGGWLPLLEFPEQKALEEQEK